MNGKIQIQIHKNNNLEWKDQEIYQIEYMLSKTTCERATIIKNIIVASFSTYGIQNHYNREWPLQKAKSSYYVFPKSTERSRGRIIPVTISDIG